MLFPFWIIYILAAIGLNDIWLKVKNSKHPQKKWFQTILITILLIYFFNIIFDKSEKHFEQVAVSWIKQQKLNINNIYFNEQRTAFYAGLITHDSVSFDEAINDIQYHYLQTGRLSQ